MSKKNQTPAVVETPAESAAPVAKHAGRPKGSKNAPRVAAQIGIITFADGHLTAGDAEFNGVEWVAGGKTATELKAALDAAQAAYAALVGLPNVNTLSGRDILALAPKSAFAVLEYRQTTQAK